MNFKKLSVVTLFTLIILLNNNKIFANASGKPPESSTTISSKIDWILQIIKEDERLLGNFY